MSIFREAVRKDLSALDIGINGARPWDIRVHDERLYRRVVLRGSLGLGEAYMDGWWDCDALDEFFHRILRGRLHIKYKAFGQDLVHRLSNLLNRQSLPRAHEVVEKHYDLGNDLYRAMLDPRMVYTCGYWKGATTLAEAQERKLDLICRKLDLKSGQRVLDIGCGFGSFAKFAAERYGVHVTGITISQEQATLAKETTKNLPVDILLQDYRHIEGMFDHIVSIGMFEAVGHKNYRTMLEIVARHLKDDGLFLLHTIGENRSDIDADPWIDKYIFPNGILPQIRHIGTSAHELFVMEDWQNFGADYDRTLMAWHRNFEEHWDTLKHRYDGRFRRMWRYYLLSCAGAFRARDIQLWQIVFSEDGRLGGYASVR